MIRKNQRPFDFTDRQILQLKRSNRSLRKLNRDALGELQRVGGRALTRTQCREAGESLGILAIRMITMVRILQETLVAGRENEVQLIQVIFSLYCENCSKNGPLERPDDDEAASREALKQDPAWQTEIDSLLNLAQRIEQRVSARCKSRGRSPSTFSRGISRLTSALLRQQRHLRNTTLKHGPEIEVLELDSDTCVDCQTPIKDDD
jgi:hypothetical protein